MREKSITHLTVASGVKDQVRTNSRNGKRGLRKNQWPGSHASDQTVLFGEGEASEKLQENDTGSLGHFHPSPSRAGGAVHAVHVAILTSIPGSFYSAKGRTLRLSVETTNNLPGWWRAGISPGLASARAPGFLTGR
jgi:hypothetical protein